MKRWAVAAMMLSRWQRMRSARRTSMSSSVGPPTVAGQWDRRFHAADVARRRPLARRVE